MCPKGWAIFEPGDINKLSGLLDDNTYQISRLFALSGPDKLQCKDCWVWPL